jgi:hypothetical protein
MTVCIYINTAKEVGDVDHLKVFASEEAAERWFAEHDPEGVAFEFNTGVTRVMVGKTPGRFTWKGERELISMAKSGASLSEIAAHFGTYVETIERKARELGVPIKRRTKE